MARRSQGTRRRQVTLAAAAAGACLALAGCGSSMGPAADGPAGTASAGTGPAAGAGTTGTFCPDASHFMRNIPAAPSTKHTTEAQARANLRKVLKATVTGFSRLDAEAPASLHASLGKIVKVYQHDEKVLRHTSSLAQVSESMVHGNASGAIAFQKVVKYISVSCK